MDTTIAQHNSKDCGGQNAKPPEGDGCYNYYGHMPVPEQFSPVIFLLDLDPEFPRLFVHPVLKTFWQGHMLF